MSLILPAAISIALLYSAARESKDIDSTTVSGFAVALPIPLTVMVLDMIVPPRKNLFSGTWADGVSPAALFPYLLNLTQTLYGLQPGSEGNLSGCLQLIELD